MILKVSILHFPENISSSFNCSRCRGNFFWFLRKNFNEKPIWNITTIILYMSSCCQPPLYDVYQNVFSVLRMKIRRNTQRIRSIQFFNYTVCHFIRIAILQTMFRVGAACVCIEISLHNCYCCVMYACVYVLMC